MKSPDWLKKKIANLDRYRKTNEILKAENIKTVCYSARCPNIHECFSRPHVTFMVLGDICMRHCSFCSVKKGRMEPPRDETRNIIRAIKKLGLKYIVITSPTRDDLMDGGAVYFANIIRSLKSEIENVKVEVLVPDFKASLRSINQVLQSGVDVFAHNIETVKRLYLSVRPQADYDRSLYVLKKAKEMRDGVITKSSMILGLGERRKEIEGALRDLKEVAVDGICLGQYLKPSEGCLEVKKFITPEEFNYFYNYALELGFKFVACGPWVRSSYQADELFVSLMVPT